MEGNLHLVFFLLIRSLSNFQVDFAFDLYSSNFIYFLARKCDISHWLPCGLDGRADGRTDGRTVNAGIDR